MTTYTFDNVEDRNDFITECYLNSVPYAYKDKDKEGKYRVTAPENLPDNISRKFI